MSQPDIPPSVPGSEMDDMEIPLSLPESVEELPLAPLEEAPGDCDPACDAESMYLCTCKQRCYNKFEFVTVPDLSNSQYALTFLPTCQCLNENMSDGKCLDQIGGHSSRADQRHASFM